MKRREQLRGFYFFEEHRLLHGHRAHELHLVLAHERVPDALARDRPHDAEVRFAVLFFFRVQLDNVALLELAQFFRFGLGALDDGGRNGDLDEGARVFAGAEGDDVVAGAFDAEAPGEGEKKEDERSPLDAIGCMSRAMCYPSRRKV